MYDLSQIPLPDAALTRGVGLCPECGRPFRNVAAHVGFSHRASAPVWAACSFDGCEQPARRGMRGLCRGHQAQRKARGADGLKPLRPWRSSKPRRCLVTACGRPTYAKGLCEKHYERERNGRPERGRVRAQTIEEHFAAHVKPSRGHWIWTGGTVPGLVIRAERTTVSARKWAFERVYGPIGRGRLSVSCGEPLCVDPDHTTRFRAIAAERERAN